MQSESYIHSHTFRFKKSELLFQSYSFNGIDLESLIWHHVLKMVHFKSDINCHTLKARHPNKHILHRALLQQPLMNQAFMQRSFLFRVIQQQPLMQPVLLHRDLLQRPLLKLVHLQRVLMQVGFSAPTFTAYQFTQSWPPGRHPL